LKLLNIGHGSCVEMLVNEHFMKSQVIIPPVSGPWKS